MKKNFMLILICFMLSFINVLAKDNVFSINKYNEESFDYIIASYNQKQKEDGFIAAGYYLKEKKEVDNQFNLDYQANVVKYKTNGEIVWTFSYGKTKEDKVSSINYSYDENNKINGYLISVDKTYDINKSEEEITEADREQTTIINISLDGKILYEKDISINEKEKIKKIVPIELNENVIDGYLAIAEKKDNNNFTSYLIRLDKDLNIRWSKNEENTEYLDIISIKESNTEKGYIGIKKNTQTSVKNLIQLDTEGNEIETINSNLNKYIEAKLGKTKNGFILYGITSEVKLKKGSYSYFIKSFDINDVENWEIIGDVPVSKNKNIIYREETKTNQSNYYFYYGNSSDKSLEVIKVSEEGIIEKKVKKIMTNYYDIKDFYIKKDRLYFVGQINCPKDDNCEYDANSLFLVSDEDKVIEVEDKDSTSILAVIGFLILIPIVILLKKKKNNKNLIWVISNKVLTFKNNYIFFLFIPKTEPRMEQKSIMK